MFFHSFEFIAVFLPLAFIGFALAHRVGSWPAVYGYLALLSLAFYGQFSLSLLAILGTSLAGNYAVARLILARRAAGHGAGALLGLGLAANLAGLGYFKYSNFAISIANDLAGAGIDHVDIILPVGISFYTFIQIGFLLEAYSGQVKRMPTVPRYVLFGAFFPVVTAGPLLLQGEFFGQMDERRDRALDSRRIAAALTLFAIGLFKKVVLADSVAPYADLAFDGVAAGAAIGALEAWGGSLAYTLQLYFDFSGYSDMAVGLGLLFGLRLPLNFNSPFKATSISDFWRRWHMTMTRFFTTYVFTPLAMRNMRRAMRGGWGPGRKFALTAGVPIFVTFLVGGIWHGAGWTFVVYGAIHGAALAIDKAWQTFRMPSLGPVAGWGLTMAVVVSGLVVFRAPDMSVALTVLAQMWTLGLAVPQQIAESAVVLDAAHLGSLIVLLGAIVLMAPNSQQILGHDPVSSDLPEGERRGWKLPEAMRWEPNLGWAVTAAAAGVVAIGFLGQDASFLYYQF